MAVVRSEVFSACKITRGATVGHGIVPYVVKERVLRLDADPASLIEVCREPGAIAKACGFSSLQSEKRKGRKDALYVIAADEHGVSKIGVSRCPIDRFVDIQNGHWSELRLFAVLWAPLRDAECIEQKALALAGSRGLRLKGEWIDAEPEVAFSLIIETARDMESVLCDSASWLTNWTARTAELLRARQRPPEESAGARAA